MRPLLAGSVQSTIAAHGEIGAWVQRGKEGIHFFIRLIKGMQEGLITGTAHLRVVVRPTTIFHQHTLFFEHLGKEF